MSLARLMLGEMEKRYLVYRSWNGQVHAEIQYGLPQTGEGVLVGVGVGVFVTGVSVGVVVAPVWEGEGVTAGADRRCCLPT